MQHNIPIGEFSQHTNHSKDDCDVYQQSSTRTLTCNPGPKHKPSHVKITVHDSELDAQSQDVALHLYWLRAGW